MLIPVVDPHKLPDPRVFSLGPFRFRSEIDIPELRSSSPLELRTTTGAGEIPVEIRVGGVPESIADSRFDGVDCYVSASEYLLEVDEVARYYAGHGREVRVEIAAGTPIANVTVYLLGSIFGALCHQNGMLPLHASAVANRSGVAAFLGPSGGGKSTLAASLRLRGYTVVADDICLLAPETGSPELHVLPVAGWLKLWSSSLKYLGEAPAEQNRVFSEEDKFRVLLPEGAAGDLLPANSRQRLTHAIFLERSAGPEEPALEPMTMPEAVAGLMAMTYAEYVPRLAGQQARVFCQAGQAMRHAQAWRLKLPWGLDRIAGVLDLLEEAILRR